MPRGGRRQGAGRPVGSKNRIPKSKDAVNRLNDIVKELETGEYLYSGAVGTAMELLQSIYRAESLPIKIRLYAATKAVDHEPKVIPQQERDAQADEAAEKILDEVRRLRAAKVLEHDEELHRWIAQGRMTEEQALLARSQWAFAEDAPWVPVQHGHDRPQKETQFQHNYDGQADCNSTAEPTKPQPQPAQNGHPQPQDAVNYFDNIHVDKAWNGGRISVGQCLFGPPHKNFWIGHKLYSANEFGEIDVTDASDLVIAELERFGYRKRR